MAQTSARRVVRQVSGGVLTAALLAACGGGEILAILQIVTPLAGSWNDSAFKESINFLTPTPDEQVFLNKLNVTAEISSASAVCGLALNGLVEVAGTLDNGKLALRLPGASADCLRGSFSSLVQFNAEAMGTVPAHSYFNTRVDVRMGTGLWVSENGLLTLKFEGPSSVFNFDGTNPEAVTGCDVSNLAAKVRFTGTMIGFNTTTLAKPGIAELLNTGTNALMFSKVEFVDGATLKLLNATGQSVTLTRKPDPVATGTTCPV